MVPIDVSKVLIVEGIDEDPLLRARAERLLSGLRTSDVRRVDDAALRDVVRDELAHRPRHGMRADFEPVAILNRFRFDDPDEERQRRIDAFPELNHSKLNGYGGFEWRESGSPAHRERTGLVCQPAWQLHTIVGCHFRCAYCNLGWFLNIMMNMEEFVGRLDDCLPRCPKQNLFQYDNFTDTVCFEPEYGGTKLLVDYFARKPGKGLELYVGKSGYVDFLLDYDHRGHTVCCWSLSGATQSRRFEYRSAPMEERIEAMRKCQEAGYPVRVRFSPIIPVRNWREENREMIRLLARDVRPDVVTIETIRFLDYQAMSRDFDLDLLDDDLLEVMKEAQGQPCGPGCELPDDYRKMVYRFIFDELADAGCQAPIAFCREKRDLWTHFADDFEACGQHPDHYFCNCGPYSAPVTAETGV